ncbi:MAG: serine/threonine-protein kinase [Gemmatimonadales bacterium]
MTNLISGEFLSLQEILAGRYSIERELGRGGMGIVLLARDVALDRPVAIKLLPPELAAVPEHRERFLREARTAAGLAHPNIVPIHLVEEHGDMVFFVMGYVDGETLRARVERSGPLTPRFAMKLLQEVAWALAYAHQRGVVHRDIKPDNIMIDQATDRALVTDFGIAQVARVGEDAPTGEIIGTARYMSPEQACGDVVDARSDLYSLGATFFYAVSGRAPFEGKNVPAMLVQAVSEPAPSIKEITPNIPERLASVIDRCLEKEPANRIQTGDDLARLVGEARGRDFRAPPLVRSFVRNAEISTMVVLAEARVQEEEADVILKRRWLRRLDGLWHRVWAGRFGRWFFKVAGTGLKPPEVSVLPSTDATEFVLGRAAVDAYSTLSAQDRRRLGDVPHVVHRLEQRAERLRREGETGERLTDTVAALESVRLALLRLRAGQGTVDDLTLHLERAKQIGELVDHELEARVEVDGILERGNQRPDSSPSAGHLN